MVSITSTSTNSKMDPTDSTTNGVEYELSCNKEVYEIYDEAALELTGERFISKQFPWFIPREIKLINKYYPAKVKRTIRNCLPIKIRID